MFDADRPITDSSQDRLGRAQFAKYVARCLLDHKDPDSMVVGLYGGWGSGKTSVINLILEELKFASSNMMDDEKPIILNFSPWSYSGQHQLIYSFFLRLSSVLRESTQLKNKDRIIYLLELYISFFSEKPIPKAMLSKRTMWQKLTFQNHEDIHGWESGRDLTKIKAELNDLLRQEKCRIIIIIDNISRLYDYEIKQIFQIVKSMGDYINTSYLLALDKTAVINAINQLDGSGGDEYVEKIVQLPFDIPPITQQDIEPILADRLSEVIRLMPEDAWNNEYWADIYYSSLRYFFSNCRDISRYINTLGFGYTRLRDIVNPVDFFALTAIEVFLPNVYAGIRDNKDLFTDLLDNVYLPDKIVVEKEKIRCDEILERDHSFPRDLLIDLMIRLFPRLRLMYRPEIAAYHSSSIARKLKRICSPEFFDSYFRLSIQSGGMPNSEFNTILAMAKNPVEFDHALTRLNQDERIVKFLDLFTHKTIQEIPRENIPAIISALLDNGDLFPPGFGIGPLSMDTPMRIHRIISACLQRTPTPEERFIIMQNAIANSTKSLYIIVHELREQSREHLEDEDTFVPVEYRMLPPTELKQLQQICVERIQYWAKHESLGTHPKLLHILYAWRDWGNPADCSAYVSELTQTDKGIVAFLSEVLDKAITEAMTKYEKNLSWEDYLEVINDFIPPKMLEEHAKILFEDEHFEKLREREQLALMIFLDLMKSESVKDIRKTTAD
ncbi:MAG TPA: P-loop NTPase fold protein [Gammaproteobacteria bacterium]|nr:P-loop NTPase fold protein [Gammaproteobacteria bacterium]